MFLTCWYLDISTSSRSVFDVYSETCSFDERVRQLVFLNEKNKDEQKNELDASTHFLKRVCLSIGNLFLLF